MPKRKKKKNIAVVVVVVALGTLICTLEKAEACAWDVVGKVR